MAIGDVFQVTVIGSVFGQRTNMTMHYRQTSGANVGPPAAGLAESAEATWVNDLLAAQSAEYSYEQTICSKIFPLPRELSWSTSALAALGSVAGDAYTANAPPTITKQTGTAGVRFRGRIYMPGLPAAYVDNGSLTGAGVIAINGASLQLVSPLVDLNGNTFQPCIYHRDDNTTTDIVFRRVNTVIRNQRRRQVGVGK